MGSKRKTLLLIVYCNKFAPRSKHNHYAFSLFLLYFFGNGFVKNRTFCYIEELCRNLVLCGLNAIFFYAILKANNIWRKGIYGLFTQSISGLLVCYNWNFSKWDSHHFGKYHTLTCYHIAAKFF